MSPVIREGLVLPATVAGLTTLAWTVLGPEWALLVLAVGAGGIIAFHLWQIDRLARWAAGSLETAVPEGRGSWRIAFAAIYRRVRSRRAFERECPDRDPRKLMERRAPASVDFGRASFSRQQTSRHSRARQVVEHMSRRRFVKTQKPERRHRV